MCPFSKIAKKENHSTLLYMPLKEKFFKPGNYFNKYFCFINTCTEFASNDYFMCFLP